MAKKIQSASLFGAITRAVYFEDYIAFDDKYPFQYKLSKGEGFRQDNIKARKLFGKAYDLDYQHGSDGYDKLNSQGN